MPAVAPRMNIIPPERSPVAGKSDGVAGEYELSYM
jgi:hypothetical protein